MFVIEGFQCRGVRDRDGDIKERLLSGCCVDALVVSGWNG